MSQPQSQTDTRPSASNYVFAPLPNSAEPPHAANPADDVGNLLFEAIQSHRKFQDFCRRLTEIFVDTLDCSGFWLIAKDEASEFRQAQPLFSEAHAVGQVVESSMNKLVEQSSKQQRLLAIETKAPANHQLIAAPVVVAQKTEFVLCAYCSLARQTSVRQRWMMSMAKMAMESWLQRHQSGCQSDFSSRLASWLQLTSRLAQSPQQGDAFLCLVNEVRSMFSANQVSLCVDHGNGFQLEAVSDVAQIDRQNESNREIKTACIQSSRTGQLVWFDRDSKMLNQDTMPLYRYAERHSWGACCSVLLPDSTGRNAATLLLAWKNPPADDRAKTEIDSRLATLLADQLNLIAKADRSLLSQTVAKAKQTARARWVQCVGGAFLLFALAMCIPMPYRINCDTQLQPVKRRYVAAPYDGTLEQTHVKHGDIVETDQVLATMDGRQLRMELAGLEADFAGARKRSESYRAVGQIAQAQIASSEMKRVSADIDVVRERLNNLEIRSPIDGIVVGGDLEQAEGAPLETGQMLYEIGPLEKMMAEVRIPEDEIQYTRPGMKVRIKFDALPFQVFDGTIARIRPRTELVEDQSVFVAEVKLENVDGQLRPGLNGDAKIKSDYHLLGWNLFHHGWESARHWLIW